MFCAFEPRLESVPARPVRFFDVLFGYSPEHPARLLTRVLDDQGEVASFILSVQLVAGGGRDKPRRTFLAETAGSETLGGFLHEFIFEPAFGEERAYRVLLNFAASRSFGKDQVTMREWLLSVVEGLL